MEGKERVLLSFFLCHLVIDFRFKLYVQELTYGCSLLLVDWWKSNGGGPALPLTKIARRIVGLCTSASACERNWSTFERVSAQVSFGFNFRTLAITKWLNYGLLFPVISDP